MSNPLLRPNDPRFQRPELRDAAGRNQFAESAAAAQQSAAGGDVYSATVADDDERPFRPTYEVQQAARCGLLLLLASLGWVAGLLGAVSLTGFFTSGWICPLLGVAPAAAAWLLGYEDLKGVTAGAIDRAAERNTRLAMWLGLTALIGCLAIVASMIYRKMQFLPDLF